MPLFALAYDCMTTGQAPPERIAEWMGNEMFRRYVEKRREVVEAAAKARAMEAG